MARRNAALEGLKKKDKCMEKDLNNAYSKYLKVMAEKDSEFKLRDEILDKQGYDVVKVKQRATQETNRKIMGILSLRVTPPLSYEEGDQSPLSGEASQLLRYQWASSMDYQPHDPAFYYLSPWLKTLYCGDYEGMMKILQNKTDAEIRNQLRVRESLYNIPAIFHVVIGARNLGVLIPENPDIYNISMATLKVEREWVKVLRKLISLGAEVSARDVAGFTPLHHCVQHLGNEVTLHMARILLEAGAEVDAQSRLGDTPLLNCTRVNKQDFIKLLLEYGANPYIPDNDGCSAFSLTSHYPQIQRLFGKGNRKRLIKMRQEMKAEAGGSFRKCSACGVFNADIKRCTGCYFTFYCSQACQRGAWLDHKQECLAVRAEFEDCVVELQAYYGRSNVRKKFYVRNSGDLPKKSNFPLKVQVNLGPLGSGQKVNETGDLYVYNKDRTIVGFVSAVHNEEVHKQLVSRTIREGCDGLKAFFYATYDGGSQAEGNNEKIIIKINTSRVLPVETW